MPITTAHKLLTPSWTADVQAAESEIRNVTPTGRATDSCHIAFFEVAGDAHLHVNVTHRHPTRTVAGWAGPGILPEGFVHNRTFSDVQARQMTRHIRDMVLAQPAGAALMTSPAARRRV